MIHFLKNSKRFFLAIIDLNKSMAVFFFLGLCALFSAFAVTTLPADKPAIVTHLYQVDNVKVDVSSTSAYAARNQAILEAQRKAFDQLISRLLPERERGKFAHLSDEEIDFVVQDFEITQEKISKLRYIGTFNIRFNPTAVEKVLSGSGTKAQLQVQVIPELLIIPLFQDAGQLLLWEEKNPWFTAWSHEQPATSGLKIVVPVGDLADISDLSAQDAMAGHNVQIAKIMRRYHVERALVALLKKEGATHTLELREYAPEGVIALSGVLPLQSESLKDEALMQAAIQKTKLMLPQLEQDFKAAAVPQKMVVTAEFKNLQQWLEIKRLLEAAPNIRGLTVASLNPTTAQLTFHQVGPREVLDRYIAAHGLVLTEKVGEGAKIYHDSSLLKAVPTTAVTTPSATPVLEPAATASVRSSPYYMPSEVLLPTSQPQPVVAPMPKEEVSK